ncbi:unnamed protein product [Paramecium primaurelia]|uniref:Mitochondrial carrier protein n=1 Tax=Paramecium primaurelia TaxID=5886 RepID=A0A8S1NLK3_PARPR|nr:unnamed protein product [Paramecium primaurelia]
MKYFIINFVSGTLSSCIHTLIGYPLDFIKTRIQIQHKKQGMIKAGIQIIRDEGVKTLYRGVSIQLLNSICAGSIYFPTYEHMRKWFARMDNLSEHSYLPFQQTFLAGSMAGIASNIFACPLEYGKILSQKTKLQKMEQTDGPIHKLFQIFKTQGFFNIYKGLKLQLMRDSIGCGLYFVSHAKTLQYFTPQGRDRTEASQFGILMASMSAAASFWSISYPIDIVKTRYQVLNESTIRIIKQIYSEGGALAFYKGFQVTVIRSVIVNIFSLCTYENLRRVGFKYF